MPPKKPPAKSTAPPEILHIAAIQRIVGKHHNQLRMPLKAVRFVLEKALSEAGDPGASRDDVRMREQSSATSGQPGRDRRTVEEVACMKSRLPRLPTVGHVERLDKLRAHQSM